MQTKQLSKLNRRELLELLLEVVKENELLTEENQRLINELEDKKIKLNQAGNIAEAALKLNRVFESAQAAADQYLYSVRGYADNTYINSVQDSDEHIKDESVKETEPQFMHDLKTEVQDVQEVEEQVIEEVLDVSDRIEEPVVNIEDKSDIDSLLSFNDIVVSDLESKKPIAEEVISQEVPAIQVKEVVYKDDYVKRLDEFLNEHPTLRDFINIDDFNEK